MPVGVLVAWVSAIAILFSPIPRWYAVLDVVIGLVLIALIFFKARIHIESRILVTVFIPLIIGVLAFLDGGFNSAGITLMLISNLIAVMLLSKNKSIGIAGCSTVIFIGLWALSRVFHINELSAIRNSLWIIQFVVFELLLVILHFLVYSIRGYLLKSIKELEKSVKRTYDLAYYDELTGLPNKNLFVKQLLEKNNDDMCFGFLIIYEIKNFSLITSMYDDATGNQVLIEVAKVLADVMKGADILAKDSGNTFVIWNDDCTKEQLLKWLNNTNFVFKQDFFVNDIKMKLELTVAYSEFSKDDPMLSESQAIACGSKSQRYDRNS